MQFSPKKLLKEFKLKKAREDFRFFSDIDIDSLSYWDRGIIRGGRRLRPDSGYGKLERKTKW